MQRLIRPGALVIVLALAGCAGGGVASTSVADTPTTVVESTTTRPTETTTTLAEVTTTTEAAAPALDGSILAVIDGALSRVHLSDGATETIIEEFEAPAVFRGSISELADGRIFYIEGWEDFWYTCEASRGQLGFVDPDNPAFNSYSFGSGLAVSPDRDSMVVIESRLCLPDPQEADWVVTPANTLFGDGDTHFEIFLETDPAPPGFETALTWAAWEDDEHLVVVDVGGTVRRVPITAEFVEHGEVLMEDLDGFPELLVDGRLWVHRFLGESQQVVTVDLASGEETVVHDGPTTLLLAHAPGGGVITGEYAGSVLTVLRPGLDDVEVTVDGMVTALGG